MPGLGAAKQRPYLTSPPLVTDAPHFPLSVYGEGERPSAARPGGEVKQGAHQAHGIGLPAAGYPCAKKRGRLGAKGKTVGETEREALVGR